MYYIPSLYYENPAIPAQVLYVLAITVLTASGVRNIVLSLLHQFIY